METIISILEIIGIISFSAAGAMVAIDKETDLFGVVFLSIITCFGGGIVRDLLVGDAVGRAVPWVFSGEPAPNLYLIISFATAILVFLVALIFKKQYAKEERMVLAINNILDAIGIGVFTAMGTAAYVELGAFVAITMGMVSSVFGGLIRDIILRDIPFVLRKYVYAVACIVGAAFYYIMVTVVMPSSDIGKTVASIGCTVIVFLIRVIATAFKLNFPKAIKFSETKSKLEAEENSAVK